MNLNNYSKRMNKKEYVGNNKKQYTVTNKRKRQLRKGEDSFFLKPGEYLKDGKPLDEILDKVPDEFYDWVKQTKEELLTQFETLDKEYQWIFKIINRVPGIENRGVFASYAKMYKHPNLLFNMLVDLMHFFFSNLKFVQRHQNLSSNY